MRRAGLLGFVLALLAAGCSGPAEPEPRGFLVTYTVESPEPQLLTSLSVDYFDGADTVRAETPPRTRSWSVDVWISEFLPIAQVAAELPGGVDQVVRDNTRYGLGVLVRCRVAVNGTELQESEQFNSCFARADLSGYDGPGSPRIRPTVHAPQLWPEPTTAAAPAPAPAGPRPETCRYATDAEITAIVRGANGSLYFAGVSSPYLDSCLYRFDQLPVPGSTPLADPLTGVTVIRSSTPFTDLAERGDPLPGFPRAVRVSDRSIHANVEGGALSVIADVGSDGANRTASEGVFGLVRDRV